MDPLVQGAVSSGGFVLTAEEERPKFSKKTACEKFHDAAISRLFRTSSVLDDGFRTACSSSMNRLKNLLLAVVLLTGVAAFGADAVTQAADAAHNVGGHAEAAHAGAEMGLPLAAPIITEIGPFKVTNSMVVMAVVALGLIIFAQLATRNIQRVPVGLQNFAEWVVESLQNFLAGILGDDLVKKTFWFFATVFLFIISANWFGLLPGVGTIGWTSTGDFHHLDKPLLRGANADLNMTLALAVAFFALWIVWSIQSNGVGGFLAHIFLFRGEASGAMKLMLIVIFFLVGFLEVISILIRPVSLTFRLYGNIYAGETLLEKMLHMGGPYFGWLAALPFYGLELMVGAIQALVFTLLTAVFTALMCRHDEGHEHGHEAHAEAGHH
jgi:F-type H+-transporting ATPase subunit a